MDTIEQNVDESERDSAFTLTAHDRCDSCGSQAYVRALTEHGELLFCAHHAKKYHAQLEPVIKEWHDESHRLVSSH